MRLASLSIRAKFALVVVGAALIAGTAVGLLSYRIGKAGLEEASEARLDMIARSRTEALQAYLTRAEQGLAEIAQNNTIGDSMDSMDTVLSAERDKIEQFFQDPSKSREQRIAYDGDGSKLIYALKYNRFHASLVSALKNAHVSDIYIIDKNGTVVFSATKGPELLKNVATIEDGVLANVVKRSKEAGESVVTTGLMNYQSETSQRSAFIARPLDYNGWGKTERRGTVIIRIGLNQLNRVIAPNDTGHDINFSLLISSDGALQAGRGESDIKQLPAQLVDASDADTAGSGFAPLGGKQVFFVWQPLDFLHTPMILAIGENEDVMLAPAKKLANSALLTTLGIVLVMALVGLIASTRLTRPLVSLADRMNRLTAGDKAIEIEGAERKDEIGAMARALESFKRNAIEKDEIEAQTLAKDQAIAEERGQVTAERERHAAEIQSAVSVLADGMKALAAGQLALRITTPFPAALDNLRLDYNRSLEQLCDTIYAIRESASVVRNGSADLRHSSEELAKRTERQAATLEETVASLAETDEFIHVSLTCCDEAVKTTERTVDDASRSSAVVHEAIAAMERIEGSSKEIETIIGVIDEIAFQTNLLALNAGVEAARAGESGKGFAVVAQEVRELAQRSAGAAAQIGKLIRRSSDEVKGGVGLVRRTGEALEQIESNIQSVSASLTTLSSTSRDQALRLGEISTAMRDLDQVTQQNAVMVDRTAASSQELAAEGDRLGERVDTFALPRQGATPIANAA
ncbi:methyl-accepting chemotaxis protein [Jiella sp. MQZ9-1]|uniref:Methyl-accepting chemotaxis protein n=1 Tax=Jiella flava TaxID=2816857 RepID=A0A939FWH2_9HYPH|nr:methyl-accepting chemotaxis protein [Jiella flava]MBO0661450.1 methyl-accepting chemotaxis protein [Jiella flava]MCD2470093.1 methyl-accepting chemotaxis protein [Jiella flava]